MVNLNLIVEDAIELLIDRRMREQETQVQKLLHNFYPATYDNPLGQAPETLREAMRDALSAKKAEAKKSVEAEVSRKLFDFLVSEHD